MTEQPPEGELYSLAGFAMQRDHVLGLIARLRAVASKIGRETDAADLDVIAESVRSTRFRVMIVGEQKTGKSTLINAMLGADILPSYDIPTTGIINIVTYGDERAVVMHYLATADGERRKPVSMSIEDFGRHVVIDHNDPLANPYERAELTWPLELCRNGVDIIDSPGLDEHPARTTVTLGYLGHADALLMVDRAIGGLGVPGREFLDTLARGVHGHDDIFFAFNRYDEVRDHEMVVSHNTRLAQPYTSRVDRRVFHTDARTALEARTGQAPPDAVEGTGIPALEAALGDFLVRERARVKLQRPINALGHELRELRGHLPDLRSVLELNEQELRARQAAQESELRLRDLERSDIVGTLDTWIRETELEIRGLARAFLQTSVEDAETWVEELDRTEKLTGNVFKLKEQMLKAAEEIYAGLIKRLTAELHAWQERKLNPYLAKRALALREKLGPRLAEYEREIDRMRAELSAVPGEAPRVGDVTQPTAIDRTIGAIGGLLLPGSAIVGGAFGTQEFLRSMGPSLLIVGGALALGVTPLGLALALAIAQIAALVGALDRANERLARQTAESFRDEVRATATERALEIAAAVGELLVKQRDEIDARLKGEAAKLREDAQAALHAVAQGARAVEERRDLIDRSERDLNAIDRELATLGESLRPGA